MKLRNKKTGEIWEIPKMRYPTAQEDDISFFAMLGTKGELFCYRSIVELNEEWEDYTPAEPLIKDEKIRKAVRAWAEALDLRWFRRCSSVNAYTSRLTGHDAEGVCYTMELKPKDLYGDKITKDSYTIAELCGEEEE